MNRIYWIGRGPSTAGAAAVFLVCCWLCGCRTFEPLPLPVLSSEEWEIRTGQAVWHQEERNLTLAGDLRIAWHRSRPHVVVMFEKPPVQVVTAQKNATQWQITFHGRSRPVTGQGDPPQQLLWLSLPDALRGHTLPSGLSVEVRSDGSFRLANPARGDWLQGYMSKEKS